MVESEINSENEYVDWFIDAQIGDKAIYHTYEIAKHRGNMLCDARARKINQVPTYEARELNNMARRALRDMEAKKVNCLQRRRNGFNEYIVVKR